MTSHFILSLEPLANQTWLAQGFIPRHPEIQNIAGLESFRSQIYQENLRLLQSQQIPSSQLHIADQVHGKEVIHANSMLQPVTPPKADGWTTRLPNIVLGIHVADCCAIYLADPATHAISLLHSGKRGTEQNIAAHGVTQMQNLYGSNPKDIIAVLSPCIHACCYDLDFAGTIQCQLRNSGVTHIWQHPDCTACHLDRYYSYRKEKGATGRMLAYLMIR